jgi:hypothetical protein
MPTTLRAALTALALLPAAPLDAEPAFRPELLPREREIAAALDAGPEAIRDAAGIYVLGARGFELARPSRNGFHCLVTRTLPTAFEPQCFDAEGSATTLQESLLDAELRMAGRSEEEIRAAIGAAWREGRLRAPARPGVNYMLSRENRVPVDEKGTVRPYRAHVMFYVPYLTNADVGGSFEGKSPIFVVNEGTAGAYAIVPVPDELVPHAHGGADGGKEPSTEEEE